MFISICISLTPQNFSVKINVILYRSITLNYIYEFDIAALLINGIVLFFYFNKKNISTFQNKIFLTILGCLGVSTLLDFLLTMQIMFSIPVSNAILWFMNCLSYTSTNLFGMLLSLYSLALVNYFENDNKRNKIITNILLFLPFVVAFITIWLSPFVYNITGNPLVFYIDQAGDYHRGEDLFFYLLYGDCLYYIVYTFVVLIVFRKKIKIRYIFFLVLYVLMVLLGVIIQLIFPEILIQYFCMSLASLVFLFYIQRPEEVLNSATDCFNQTAFVRVLSQEIRSHENVTCISIILDDTYFLANTFGMSKLDDFMRGVANYLKQSFKYQNIYQLNQGCFCVVIKDSTKTEVQNIIGQLQNRFNQIWDYDSIHLKLYSRLCIIECPQDAKTAEEIIDIINMVTSDERYKQSIVMASEIDIEYKRRTMYMDHAVRTGLFENKMEVYYQPIWSTKEGRLIGAEALIRLRDDEGNFISPEDFIPIAEKNGSILRIGEFVFESVCRTLSSIDVKRYGIEKIDINLSVAQCMQEILAEQILTIRSMYNIPASLINLEITETAAAHTPEILLKNMQRLSDAGFELSLDDYGSGYSNMSYMLNLPFKMIKIDKYIVWSAFEQKRNNIALSATIKMIKELGMTVLAEGIEKQEHADWLTILGCDYLQGYYYSKPCPRDEYLKIMAEDVKRYAKQHPEIIVEDDFEELEDAD